MWRCCTSVSPCHSGLAWCAGENTCPCPAPPPLPGIFLVLDPNTKIRLTILNIIGWLCSLPHSPPRAVVTCSALCHVGDTCLASDTCQGPLVTTAWRTQCLLCATDTQTAHSLPRPWHSEVIVQTKIPNPFIKLFQEWQTAREWNT